MSELLTMQDLANGHLDVKALGEAANGDENTIVTTRTGNTYPSAERAINIMFKNGGLPAEPFETKASMETEGAALVDGHYAMVTDDTVNNGLYVKTAGAWIKSGYDPALQAKNYSDANKLDYSQIEVAYRQGNLIGAKTKRHTNFGLGAALAPVKVSNYDALVLTVNEGDVLFIHNDKGTYRGSDGSGYGFFANNPYIYLTQTRLPNSEKQFTDVKSGIVYRREVVPVGARYLVVNTRRTTSGSGGLPGVTTTYDWAIHKGAFNRSYVTGKEFVAAIAGTSLASKDQYPSTEYRVSDKNIYKGGLQTKVRLVGTVVQATTSEDDVISPYVPVEFGKHYTISGLQPLGLRPVYTLVHGTSENFAQSHVKTLATAFPDGIATVYIDDPAIKYIVFSLTGAESSSYAKAAAMSIQVEEGQVATLYEPHITSDLTNKLLTAIASGSGGGGSGGVVADAKEQVITNFVELNKVRNPLNSTVGTVIKNISPVGISYSVKGGADVDSVSNNLFAKIDIKTSGTQALHAHLMNFVGDVKTNGVLQGRPFTVPSGQLDNPDTLPNYAKTYPLNSYVHPSVAYNATGVAGFKYWMISSTFPPYNAGDAIWEDEDMFVSNDAKTWQRIRSLYESAKTYTTAELRLPAQGLATTNARKHAILPSPPTGAVIEVSVPADNGAAAEDRTMVTLTGFPWKHDPFIMIDGGFVYTYHTYNMDYQGSRKRFIVCVRTNDGVNWDVVRTDGSTMRLTVESSKTLFTKSADGKYNYMYYVNNKTNSNLEIVKYGEGDYEFIYGINFSRRHTGTTPYSFDFTTSLPFQDLGSGNHPTLFLNADTLYLINANKMYSSVNRGQNWTEMANYPAWFGGVEGLSYKKSGCIGEGGKFILFDVQRTYALEAARPIAGRNSVTNDINRMSSFEYPSFADFISKATTGLVDGYIDVTISKINYATGKRVELFFPAVNVTLAPTSGGMLVIQRVKIADIAVERGDILFMYVTLNSRNGGQVIFGGIDIS